MENLKVNENLALTNKVWLEMEYRLPNGLLSKVYLPIKLKQNGTKAKYKALIYKTAKRVFREIIKFGVASITGLLTAACIIPKAEAARGYEAIGGEYLLILIVIALTLYFTEKLFSNIERK